MRKTDLDILATRRPAPSFLTRLGNAGSRFFRAWRNRRALHRLSELDDHQLFDMGLARSDVRDMRAASVFTDSGLHLTIAARERARRHLRGGRAD